MDDHGHPPHPVAGGVVDQIRFRVMTSSPLRLHVSAPGEVKVLGHALGYWASNPGDLKYLAGAVAERSGTTIDNTGFRYPHPEMLDPGEKPFEGVNVHNPMGDIYVDAGAFERLMSRYLRLLTDEAERLGHPATREAWWPELRETLAAIQARGRSRQEEPEPAAAPSPAGGGHFAEGPDKKKEGGG